MLYLADNEVAPNTTHYFGSLVLVQACRGNNWSDCRSTVQQEILALWLGRALETGARDVPHGNSGLVSGVMHVVRSLLLQAKSNAIRYERMMNWGDRGVSYIEIAYRHASCSGRGVRFRDVSGRTYCTFTAVLSEQFRLALYSNRRDGGHGGRVRIVPTGAVIQTPVELRTAAACSR